MINTGKNGQTEYIIERGEEFSLSGTEHKCRDVVSERRLCI